MIESVMAGKVVLVVQNTGIQYNGYHQHQQVCALHKMSALLHFPSDGEWAVIDIIVVREYVVTMNPFKLYNHHTELANCLQRQPSKIRRNSANVV